jgi:uncharacterized membrane protein YfcA
MAAELGVVGVGLLAGIIAGMLGVGGGALFAPALVIFLGESQLHAEATSLLAILPTALVGAWRQQRYGNLRLREGLTLGGLAVGGGLVGVALANAVPEQVLRTIFAVFILFVAFQLVRRERRRGETEPTQRGELA